MVFAVTADARLLHGDKQPTVEVSHLSYQRCHQFIIIYLTTPQRGVCVPPQYGATGRPAFWANEGHPRGPAFSSEVPCAIRGSCSFRCLSQVSMQWRSKESTGSASNENIAASPPGRRTGFLVAAVVGSGVMAERLSGGNVNSLRPKTCAAIDITQIN